MIVFKLIEVLADLITYNYSLIWPNFQATSFYLKGLIVLLFLILLDLVVKLVGSIERWLVLDLQIFILIFSLPFIVLLSRKLGKSPYYSSASFIKPLGLYSLINELNIFLCLIGVSFYLFFDEGLKSKFFVNVIWLANGLLSFCNWFNRCGSWRFWWC